jgi:cytosine/adenosine deaminase-related metal-dependent hydrolase
LPKSLSTLIPAHWVVPVDTPPIRHGFVKLDGRTGRIIAVGRLSELPLDLQQNISLSPNQTTILTPGLINTHTHLELTFDDDAIDKMSTNGTFSDWLIAVVTLTRDVNHNNNNAKAYRISRGLNQLLQDGCTTVNDISSDGLSLTVIAQKGLRGRISLEFFNPALKANEGHLKTTLAAVKHYWLHQTQTIAIGLSPHSPYNVSPQAWQWMLDQWHQQFGRPPWVHTHVAESVDEQAWLLGNPNNIDTLHQSLLQKTFTPQSTGLSSVAYLKRYGLLTPQTMLAHGVLTSDADQQIVKSFGLGLAHCPRSNYQLHQQTLLAKHWQDYPALGLGTDSLLSCPSLSVRAEARFAMALHGWTGKQTLRILTEGGARAMGLQDTIGTLTPNKAFDAVLWSIPSKVTGILSPEDIALSPNSIASQLWVDGRLIYEKSLIEELP